jgi:hypothetical protein
VSLLLFALTFGFSGAASATPLWMNGNEVTYSEASWTSPGAALLLSDFDSVYAPTTGVLTLGLPSAGFTMKFTDAIAVLSYLPAVGVPGPLNQGYVNPTSTSSGFFGGNVLALELDVDFSDAGSLVGNLGIPFGDLVLANFGPLSLFNGRTVRQILGADNSDLGGGNSIFSIADLDALTVQLAISFDSGIPSTFAQEHLVAPTSNPPAQVPEPATLTLAALGLVGVVIRRRRPSQSTP